MALAQQLDGQRLLQSDLCHLQNCSVSPINLLFNSFQKSLILNEKCITSYTIQTITHKDIGVVLTTNLDITSLIRRTLITLVQPPTEAKLHV